MLLLALVLACAGSDCEKCDTATDDTAVEGDADTDADADADADADSDADADADAPALEAIPDVRGDMPADGSACDRIGGYDGVLGAAVWYWGQFAADGTGQEAWYLLVNEPWAAKGGADCVVTWDLTWEDTDAGSCSDCDGGVLVTSASVAPEWTTCPDDAWSFYDPTGEAYAIDVESDGVVFWHFPSGTRFASGYWAVNVGMNYLADGGCDVAWF